MAKQITLFNFFSKSPSVNKSPKPRNDIVKDDSSSIDRKEKSEFKSPINKTPKTKTPKTDRSKKSKSSEKENITQADEPVAKKARKRIIVDDESDEDASPSKETSDYPINSDDSEDDFKPEDHDESSESDVEPDASEPESPSAEEESPSPAKGKKRKRPEKTSKPNKKPTLTPAKGTPNETFKQSSHSSEATAGDNGNWSYLKYDFLKPEKIRDAKRRRPDDPNYDPKTLYVSDEFLKNCTPAMRQWWEMKAKNFDCVLFFKLGKFYEFYHMDAVTGVKELNLAFMKGDYAHCGFPEIAYGRFSANLIDKGYKVARVEQTETPEMMNERCKKILKASKFDKVVKREICQMTTKGTQIYTVADGQCKEPENKYLLAVCEKELDSVKSRYGVCFIDTSIGTFHVGQFDDDRHCSRLRTLIAMYPPVQLLLERSRLTKRTQNVLNTALSNVMRETLSPESEFLSASSTLTTLTERNYFPNNQLPPALKEFIGADEAESLCLSASDESELGVRSLGAVLSVLTRSLLDHQLFSMSQFQKYIPVDSYDTSSTQSKFTLPNRNMVLDAVTLRNLNIVDNGCGTKEGTLLNKLDHCCTQFGKRLLHHWVCSPVTNVDVIKGRQEAVLALKDNPELIKETRSKLTKLPDLERLIFRIHAQSSKGLPENHPDTRAILFEEKAYSKRKITEFLSVLNGFQVLQETATLFQGASVCNDSSLLARISCFPNSSTGGCFPDLAEHLKFFKNAFDHEEAEKAGKIKPSPGVDHEYDDALQALEEIDADLKKYLKKQCEYFGVKVSYVGTDKKRYQLEVTDAASRKAGDGYELMGQRKGFKRYSTPETKELLERQQAAEEMRNNLLHNLCNRIFSKFSDRFEDWNTAVQNMALIDVLLSFAEYYLSQDCDMCMPDVKNPSENHKGYVKLHDGKYPCVVSYEDFIPNDTAIGEGPSSVLLLTGPNMGGKSTLMRQLGLITIMAQMGCPVPASSLEMTVVDRIFTRIGANDDIMAGDSTFYVELCETSSILHHATKHSLVLIDELGRGTSTYDGTAIAASVLKELCRMDCRTIFSTHYHSLVEDFKNDPKVFLGHMACMSEEDENEGGEETVTFLYKLTEGACPKSYGFNAARLAGVPSLISRVGRVQAALVEKEAAARSAFRALVSASTKPETLRQLISSL